MDPQKEVLRERPEPRRDSSQSRFQIVKLEERVAPRTGHQHYHYHRPGWYRDGNYGPPGQTK
jgi:hypothetical protein